MPDDKPKTMSVEEVLKRANVPTANGPAPAAVKEAPAEDGAFMANGKMMYRYTFNGEVIVTPKPIENMTEQEFYDAAIPMLLDNSTGRLPANLTVRFKDPQYAGHWFNKAAGKSQRIGVARTLGFVPATKADLDWFSPELNDTDGALEQGGDLVLFKIHKAKLFMYFKQNLEKSRRQGGVEGYRAKANEGLNPANRSKDPFWVGPQATEEFTGVGPVVSAGDGGKLITNR